MCGVCFDVDKPKCVCIFIFIAIYVRCDTKWIEQQPKRKKKKVHILFVQPSTSVMRNVMGVLLCTYARDFTTNTRFDSILFSQTK